jgi:hypothetical protein
LCVAAQPLFFKLLHLYPGPLAGYLRIGSLQGQVDVRIGQEPLQLPDPLFELFLLVNFFWFFHSYPYASTAIPVFSKPLGHRIPPNNPILAPHLIHGQIILFNLPHNRHFERFTIPATMI